MLIVPQDSDVGMVRIEFEPDLTSCIETLSKREYRRLVKALLGEETEDAETHDKAELLRLFLESADFGRLRGEYEGHLVEGRRVRFTIYRSGDRPEYEIEVS